MIVFLRLNILVSLDGVAEIAGPKKVARQLYPADPGSSAHEQTSASSSTEHASNLLIGSLASHARVGGNQI